MSGIDRKITFAHPQHRARENPRSTAYVDLWSAGHGYREKAGLFDQVAAELVQGRSIGPREIRRLIEAADAELSGSTVNEALDDDLGIFCREWSFKFSDAAWAVAKRRLGELPERKSLGDVPADDAEVNGQFYAVMDDGVVTEDEVGSLLAQPHRDNNRAFVENFARMYAADGVTWRKGAVAAFRAGLSTEPWMHKVDLERFVAKNFNDQAPLSLEDAQQITDEAMRVFSENFGSINNAGKLKWALQSALQKSEIGGRRGYSGPEQEARSTPEAREHLQRFMNEDGFLQAALAALLGKRKVTEKAALALMHGAAWSHGQSSKTAVAKIIREALSGLDVPYWEHPRFTRDAIAVLDRTLISERSAEGREKFFDADLVGLLYQGGKFLKQVPYGRVETAFDDGAGPVMKLTLENEHVARGWQPRVEISGYVEGAVLTIRKGNDGPEVTVDPKTVDAPDMRALVNDTRLNEAVRKAFHAGLGYEMGSPFAR